MTTSDNIAAIEAIEEAMKNATPGPWEWRERRGLSHFDVLSGGNCQDVLSAEEYAGASWIEISADDAAYIAACSPDRMSALLAEARKAEAMTQEIAEQFVVVSTDVTDQDGFNVEQRVAWKDILLPRAEAAEARVAKMEAFVSKLCDYHDAEYVPNALFARARTLLNGGSDAQG